MIKEYKGMIVFVAIHVLLGYGIRYDIGNGLLIGACFGLFHYYMMNQVFSLMVMNKQVNGGLFMLYFIGNFGVFAAPLYIGCVYPDFVNVFGAAFGLLFHNIYIYGATLLQRLKERRDEIRQI